MEEDIRNQIQELKAQIKEIYYIREYEKAREFENALEEIEKSSYAVELTTSVQEKLELQKKLYGLRFEIYRYRKQEGNEKKAHFLPEEFAGKIKQFIEEMSNKDSETLITELKKIVEEAKEVEVKPIVMDKLNQLFAKALLHIFMLQAKNHEVIDLKLVEEISTKKNLAEEIQAKLIEISENKPETEALAVLNLCRTVDGEHLQEKEIWKVLTGEEVSFQKEIELVLEPKLEPSKEELLALQPKKLSFFDKMRKQFGMSSKTTKYVFLEKGKRKEEYHQFPPRGRLLKRCGNSCIELEINDEEIVKIDCIDDMRNLETLKFGKNVRLITREKEVNVSVLKYGPKKISFSDDVEKLKGMGLFSQNLRLEEVHFGKNIKEISRRCFMNCSKLEEVNLPDSLKILENQVFCGCSELKNVEFGTQLEEIHSECFCYCHNLENINLPDSLKKIEVVAFCQTSIERVSIPEGVPVEAISIAAFDNGVQVLFRVGSRRNIDRKLVENDESEEEIDSNPEKENNPPKSGGNIER